MFALGFYFPQVIITKLHLSLVIYTKNTQAYALTKSIHCTTKERQLYFDLVFRIFFLAKLRFSEIKSFLIAAAMSLGV